MIGLDTNVLVRYLTQDEPAQSILATHFIERKLSEGDPGFVGLVVLVETTWVLQSLYGATRDEILETVGHLLASRSIVVENRDAVARALARCATNGCSFADALVAASAASAGCDHTVSFDRGAVRAGMTLLR